MKKLRNEPNHVPGILAKVAWSDAERYGCRGEVRAGGLRHRARSGSGAAATACGTRAAGQLLAALSGGGRKFAGAAHLGPQQAGEPRRRRLRAAALFL
jgi:hypothetical protein